MDAIIIERDYKGEYERYALTREEFRKEYPDLWPVGASEDAYIGGSRTISPLVHMWYTTCNVGSIIWNEFFTNMKYGLPESDISRGNLAYVREDLFKALKRKYDQWKFNAQTIGKTQKISVFLIHLTNILLFAVNAQRTIT